MQKIKPKKFLGQHFLNDVTIAEKIVGSLTLHRDYDTVLEIGPGMGVLTKFLLHQKEFETFVIEIDFSSVEYLKNNFPELKGKIIEVTTNEKTRAKQLVREWYLQNAKTKFYSIAKPLIEKFKKHKVEPSSIVFRDMPTRWGSCTPKGKIILNPELIKAPKGCIEYVIIHELCHLIHHDHTQKFLDLQTKEMRDWEKWKTKLEKLLA